MKTFSLALVVVLSAAGCKKDGPDCAKALDKSMELSKGEMQNMPGVDDKMIQKMKDLGVQHCKDDKWSADVVQCMSDSTSMAASQACYGKLSQEQQDKMNKAAMEMASPPAPAGGATAGSAAGSADGSAAPRP